MAPIPQATAIFSFLKKIFTFQEGAILLLALPCSASLTGILNTLLDTTPVRAIALPLLTAAITLSLYFLVFLLDFASGIRASRHEAADKSNYFTSAKGWNSVWKISTVTILVLWSGFFSILAAIAQLPALPTFFMFTSASIGIMATLLDIYSIGENQKRITGKKSRIFLWLENITNLINKAITTRIKNIFKIN